AKKHLEVLGSSCQEGKLTRYLTYSTYSASDVDGMDTRARKGGLGFYRVILPNEPEHWLSLKQSVPDERCLIARHRRGLAVLSASEEKKGSTCHKNKTRCTVLFARVYSTVIVLPGLM
ncbi:hypothetical protein PspLS_02839, partial [Pyricularia sp. CBS 133598]